MAIILWAGAEDAGLLLLTEKLFHSFRGGCLTGKHFETKKSGLKQNISS